MQTVGYSKNRKNKKTPELAFVSNAAKKTPPELYITKPYMQPTSYKIFS